MYNKYIYIVTKKNVYNRYGAPSYFNHSEASCRQLIGVDCEPAVSEERESVVLYEGYKRRNKIKVMSILWPNHTTHQ